MKQGLLPNGSSSPESYTFLYTLAVDVKETESDWNVQPSPSGKVKLSTGVRQREVGGQAGLCTTMKPSLSRGGARWLSMNSRPAWATYREGVRGGLSKLGRNSSRTKQK